MRKRGKTGSGKQRWFCPVCRVSAVRKRDDARQARFRQSFLRWFALREHRPQWAIAHELRVCRATISRRFSALLNNPPTSPRRGADILVLDGFYFGKRGKDERVALIARSPRGVCAWAFARSESRQSWSDFIATLPPPSLVVADGAGTLLYALAKQWAQVPVQRCQWHVSGEVARRLRGHRGDAERALRQLALALKRAKSGEECRQWRRSFAQWQSAYAPLLAQQELFYGKDGRRCRRPQHRALCAAHAHIQNALPALFAFAEHPGAPNTNNHLEGGINAKLRRLLQNHPGLPVRHQQSLIAHLLLSKCPKKAPRNVT